MIIFKCTKCGKLQRSSCITSIPCKKCGGRLRVHDVEYEEEEYQNAKRDRNKINRRKSEIKRGEEDEKQQKKT